MLEKEKELNTSSVAQSAASDKEDSSKKPPKQKKKKKFFFSIFIIWVMAAITAGLFLFPTFANGLSGITRGQQITSMASNIQSMSKEELDAEKTRAREYNQKIWEQQQWTTFGYTVTGQDDPEYNSLLNTGAGGIMCTIEIPALQLYIPAAHGTSEKVLSFEAGHMYGSSLPIGGNNSHSILAAHTGLATAELFTNIKKLVNGDVIYIHVLDEIHVYTVIDQNFVAQGDDEPQYLQIEEGKDLITLYTCGPYGVNDHRVLVKAERTYPDLEVGGDGGMSDSVKLNRIALIQTCGIGSIPFILLIIGIIRSRREVETKK